MGKFIKSFFILSAFGLLNFTFLSQTSYVNKQDIKTIYYRLAYLYVDYIIKLTSMSLRLKIINSITQLSFFSKICILAKQIKYIFKGPDIKTETLGRIIYIDLLRCIILIRFNRLKYGLLMTDEAIWEITKILLKKKSQVIIKLL